MTLQRHAIVTGASQLEKDWGPSFYTAIQFKKSDLCMTQLRSPWDKPGKASSVANGFLHLGRGVKPAVTLTAGRHENLKPQASSGQTYF